MERSTWTPILTLIFIWITTCGAVSRIPAKRTEHVCHSIDIKNHVDAFQQLTNCTVIEGSLQILLIDNGKPSDYEPLSFPLLTEITNFLLLYRVYGLRSLAHIFPNLSVIRGQRLFYNYALVAFEMPDLEELGLHRLTNILRGGVRLDKNPRLCYIDTVDWRRMTQGNVPLDIAQNKESGLCLDVCPRHADSSHVCATRTVKVAGGGERQQPLCWTADSCQIVCSSHCGSRSCYVNPVTSQTECCSPQCVGGCHGPSASHCIACHGVFQNGGCQNVCTGNTYEFIQRRCISEDECRHIGEGNWKMVDGKCIEQCPIGYTKTPGDQNLCRKCDGPCPSVCEGLTVDTIAAARKLKGCTVIDGFLSIQVGGEDNVGRELEENLGMIEEVTHFVKVANCHALLSLQFLRSLKRIQGVHLHSKKYALWVLDNHNLQDIWDMSKHPQLTIDRGKVFFHFNRKLCLDKIRLLTDTVGLTAETTEQDVSTSTNGDQVACDMMDCELSIYKVSRSHALICWNKFDRGDFRALLGWVINYREAPEKNINFYNARDACGSDVWETINVERSRAAKICTIVHGLKPYTQYGIYIQTYTIATSNYGAISSLLYFKTEPEEPTPVRDIQVENRKAKELHITWKEPNRPNGSIAYYHVSWQPQKLVASTYDRRNYCIDKMYEPIAQTKPVVKPEKNTTTAVEDGDCCVCPKSQATKRMEQHERLFQIQFENFLHNSVYKKRPLPSKSPSSESRRKRRRRRRVLLRPLANSSFGWQTYRNLVRDSNYTGSNASRPSLMQNNKKEGEPNREEVVSGKTSIVLTNLSHYQAYSIEVITCHEYPELEHINEFCSNRAVFTARTLSVESADVINHENVTAVNVSSNVSVRRVNITWQEPVSPNGLIVTYEIELAKVDAVNFKPEVYCISHKTYRRIGGYLTTQLNSGNWSYRLRATSLAGKGAWTPFMHFYVAEFSTSNQSNIGLIVGIAIGFTLILAGVLGVGIWVVAKKRFQPPVPNVIVSANPEYWPSGDAYIPDEWEVPRDKIKLIRELGQGSFGMVYEGTAKDIVAGKPGVIKVAVKTVNESASFRERIDFLNEACIMKGCDCNHVVKLLGVVSKGQPTLVIMELMSNGDLKSFLREHRPDEELGTELKNPPSLAEILQMAGEIADGMAYLAFKKYVHRDLAARNCMVSGDMVVKIGDFGMTRDIYETDYYRKGSKGLLPVRWMAPESLQDGLFTSQSDVWSFGVVLWEMVTLAAQPYQGLSNEQVLKYVSDGGIMERPAGCPDRLYKLMLQCWQMRAKQRPRFGDIIQMLLPDLSESFKAQSYYCGAKLQSSSGAGHLPVDDDEDDDVMDSAASSLLLKRWPLNGTEKPHEDAGSEHSSLSYNSRHSPTPSPPKMAVALPLTASSRTGNAAERPSDARRTSAVSNSNSTGGGAVAGSGGTNDGSKGSSQSSSSGGPPRNGLSNKHIHAYLPAMRCTDC